MKCRHCKNKIMELVIDLGCQPPSNSYLTERDLNKKENYFPLKVFICDSCFLVQTQDTTNKKTFFNSNYAYFSSTSTTWLGHSKRYVSKVVDELKLDNNSFVLEIASNDGYLLKNFLYKNIPCLAPVGSLSYHISRSVPAINENWKDLWNNSFEKYKKIYGGP